MICQLSRFTGAACLALAALGSAACQSPEAVSTAGSQGGAEVAATVDGQPVTIADVDARIKEELFRERASNPSKLHELREATLERMIDDRVLESEASRRGVAKEAVVELEIEALGPIGEEDIDAFLTENAERLSEADPEELRPQVRQYLEAKRASEVPTRLRERADIVVSLEPPRFEVAPDGPGRGPADAPITIVEFSDFQCPYCQRSVATIDQVLEKYPEQVRIVYRHLPLDRIHRNARPAAEAAACADEQEQFWPYHDKLFENNRQLGKEDLLRYAEELGLDVESFKVCVEERRFKDKVESDFQAARAIGVSGTPAFVINGVVLSGARPAEAFYEVIDAELERLDEGRS